MFFQFCRLVDRLSFVGYISIVKYELHSTATFSRWFGKIKDVAVKQRILARLARVENGSFGDCKQLSGNLFELRFFFAGGLRIYYTIREEKIVLLLAGGGKTTQHKDIATAEKLMRETEV